MSEVIARTRAAPGRKGARTRARLLAAARDMLVDVSPLDLTVVSVSRRAGTAPPSFYVYFADIRDLMLALAEEVASESSGLAPFFDCGWPPDNLKSWCDGFVQSFIAAWQADCAIHVYRNMEADRGDPDFDNVRVRASLPVLEALTDRMLAAHPPEAGPRRVEAFAESVILYAGLERLAGLSPTPQPSRLHTRHYAEAYSRILSAAVTPRPGSRGLKRAKRLPTVPVD